MKKYDISEWTPILLPYQNLSCSCHDTYANEEVNAASVVACVVITCTPNIWCRPYSRLGSHFFKPCDAACCVSRLLSADATQHCLYACITSAAAVFPNDTVHSGLPWRHFRGRIKYWHLMFHAVIGNFYAPWCPWCQRLEPTWEAVREEVHTKYPDTDGRIHMAKVLCSCQFCKACLNSGTLYAITVGTRFAVWHPAAYATS